MSQTFLDRTTAARELLVLGGLPADELIDQLDFTGDDNDPVLHSPLRSCAAVQAAIGCHGLAASHLWWMRTGRKQRVTVDLLQSSAALNSYHFLHKIQDGCFNRQQRLPLWNGGCTPSTQPQSHHLDMVNIGVVTAMFPCKDGRHFFLHGSFAPAKALKVLGLDLATTNPKEVADTIMKWEAQALEDAFAAQGIPSAMARSPAEWNDHPQGKALATVPVVEIIKLSAGPPVPLPECGNQPLSGINVLDLTRVLAGPTCTRTLAEHGASVLQVHSPDLPFVGSFVVDTGHGKRPCFLDLKLKSAADQLRGLINSADVFVQSYRGGAMDKLGFSPEEVMSAADAQKGIVYVTVSCFGSVGPWKERPGWEQVAQTVSGVAALNGAATSADGTPTLIPAAATDCITGNLAAFGTIAALAARAREGGSYHVRVSLTSTAMFLQRFGEFPPEAVAAVKDKYSHLTLDDLAKRGWFQTSVGPHGTLAFLGPAVQMSETPATWELPSVPLGFNSPTWDANVDVAPKIPPREVAPWSFCCLRRE
eukprot:TRINITY_DN18164_c0_g1_i1.p1 TRINITY_DN18164_c0_g1~~TRINITY_DN18164_c0_g1_i1.p1  ORF type:complete len:535 (+),score=67.08 TRINITY_DN18164_c0_g1_i1:226-1830(+)